VQKVWKQLEQGHQRPPPPLECSCTGLDSSLAMTLVVVRDHFKHDMEITFRFCRWFAAKYACLEKVRFVHVKEILATF
jgi:hypothetical protein